MNKFLKNKAFTLVELIVVITILAVLATVAFVSFQWYAASSRDSVRLADITSMEKLIALHKVKEWKYPNPNEAIWITYSWSLAWTQWVFWTNSYTNNTSLSEVPVDPITGLPYAYSITNTKQQYQLATVLEWEISKNISSQTYAWDQVAKIYVRWDYNGKIIKIRKDTQDLILWVPSILASDISDVRLENIITNKQLVYKWYSNLPASFSGSIYNTTPSNGFNFEPNQVEVFQWNISDLENNTSARVVFLDNLQTNYSATIISTEENISEVLNVSSSSSKANNLVATILNNNIGTEIKYTTVENTPELLACEINPSPESDFVFNEATGTITSYIGSGGNVVIPCKINGKPILIIWNGAFAWKWLTWIAIPNTVNYLWEWSFSSNDTFNNLYIPDSVTSVWVATFYGTKIINLVIGEWLVNISNDMFSGSFIENIDFWGGVKNIGRNAFYPNNIVNLTIPNNIETIWHSAFNTSLLLEKITLGNWLISIDDYAFAQSMLLTEIDFWNSLESIWYFTFSPTKIKNVTLPDSINNIDSYAFYNTPIETLNLWNWVKTIGWSAFNGGQLTSISIPSNVESIWDRAFKFNPVNEW